MILYQQAEGYNYLDFFYDGWRRPLLVTTIAGVSGVYAGGNVLVVYGNLSWQEKKGIVWVI